MLKESEEDLKSRLAAKEKELQEKCEEVEIPATILNVETNTTSLSNAMSQVKIRDVEITRLKQQNKNLEYMASKKEEEKNKLAERYQELIDQNVKLNKKVIGQMALQGARYMIWDEIIKEASKFRLYLDYVVDQENALMSARKNVVVVKQTLNKNPIKVA